jgi:hypothetical protein
LIAELPKPTKKDVTIDPNFPLRLSLDYLEDLLDVPRIAIDYEAFQIAAPQVNPNDIMDVKGIKVKAGDWSLEALLEEIGRRTKTTYLIRPQGITFVPWSQAHAEVWGSRGTVEEGDNKDQQKGKSATERGNARKRLMLPLVHANFDQCPLDEALQRLGKSSSFSVVLDVPRAGVKARTAVTALLANVPLDTAVRVLANQGDLKAVRLDNVFYVTTVENAAVLQAEQDKLGERELVPLPGQESFPKE